MDKVKEMQRIMSKEWKEKLAEMIKRNNDKPIFTTWDNELTEEGLEEYKKLKDQIVQPSKVDSVVGDAVSELEYFIEDHIIEWKTMQYGNPDSVYETNDEIAISNIINKLKELRSDKGQDIYEYTTAEIQQFMRTMFAIKIEADKSEYESIICLQAKNFGEVILAEINVPIIVYASVRIHILSDLCTQAISKMIQMQQTAPKPSWWEKLFKVRKVHD